MSKVDDTQEIEKELKEGVDIATVSEDSVVSDVGAIKNFLNKLTGKVIKGVRVGKQKTQAKVKATQTLEKTRSKGWLKYIKIIVVILLLILVFIIGSKFASNVINNTETPVIVVPPKEIPTIPPFNPYRPTIYADDELILKIEENVKVLINEMSTTPLKESSLNPPVLDFNVKF